MVAALRSVLSALSDALEMACGWALLAVGLYALLFIDVTGRGSLWSGLRGLNEHAWASVESPKELRTITVAAGQPQEDRFLVVPDAEIRTRPETAVSDSPAGPKVGESWTRSLQGRLRSFTIYGEGEQTTSAVAQTQSSVAHPAAAAPVAIVAAFGSAAHAGAAAAARPRPGVGTRLSGGVAAQSDSVRNIR